jgi:hypothetical protein
LQPIQIKKFRRIGGLYNDRLSAFPALVSPFHSCLAAPRLAMGGLSSDNPETIARLSDFSKGIDSQKLQGAGAASFPSAARSSVANLGSLRVRL